jgi:hypothetical protein
MRDSKKHPKLNAYENIGCNLFSNCKGWFNAITLLTGRDKFIQECMMLENKAMKLKGSFVPQQYF